MPRKENISCHTLGCHSAQVADIWSFQFSSFQTPIMKIKRKLNDTTSLHKSQDVRIPPEKEQSQTVCVEMCVFLPRSARWDILAERQISLQPERKIKNRGTSKPEQHVKHTIPSGPERGERSRMPGSCNPTHKQCGLTLSIEDNTVIIHRGGSIKPLSPCTILTPLSPWMGLNSGLRGLSWPDTFTIIYVGKCLNNSGNQPRQIVAGVNFSVWPS